VEIRIFISYAHENEVWLQEKDDLGKDNPRCLLKRWRRTLDVQSWSKEHKVLFWYDREADQGLRGGELWRTRIIEEIDRADVAVLLITEDFVVSPFIRDSEPPRILEQSKTGELEVVPILLEPSNYKNLHLADVQVTPGEPTPLTTSQAESEDAWKRALLDISSSLVGAVERAIVKREGQKDDRGLPPPPPPEPAPRRHKLLRRWPLWVSLAVPALAFVLFLVLRRPSEPPVKRLSAGSSASAPTGHVLASSTRGPAPDRTTRSEATAAPASAPFMFAMESGVGFDGPGHAITAAFSADGKQLSAMFTGAYGGEHPTIRSWSLEPRRQLSSCAISSYLSHAATFSPDQTRALVGYMKAFPQSGGAGLLDAVTCRELQHLDPANGDQAIRHVDFLPDGKTAFIAWRGALSTDARGFVEAWAPDGVHAKRRREFQALGNWLNMMAVDAAGRRLVLIEEQEEVRGASAMAISAWDFALKRELWRLDGTFEARFSSLAVSPDGELLLAGRKGGVSLVSMKSGQELGSLACPGGFVHAVAFSPDGRLVVAGGQDYGMCLWKLASRRLLGVSKTIRLNTVNNVAFAPDGRQIAVSASSVHVYPVPQP
jgi:hypothetical protein